MEMFCLLKFIDTVYAVSSVAVAPAHRAVIAPTFARRTFMRCTSYALTILLVA